MTIQAACPCFILLRPEPFQRPDHHTLLMVTIGAVCFVLYHLFNGRAYRGGDLSVVYPLCQTSMIVYRQFTRRGVISYADVR